MKRAWLILLALLFQPSWAADAPWPQLEGNSFSNASPEAIKVRMCDADGLSNCGPTMALAAGRTGINCGYWVFGTPAPPKDAAGKEIYKRKCFIVAEAPPPPPPPPPPVVVLPVGVSFVAAIGVQFKVNAITDLKMCKNDFTACSKAVRFPASQGESYFCNVFNFKDNVGGEACFSVPLYVAKPDTCYPAVDIDNVNLFTMTYTSKNYRHITVPASVNSTKPYLSLFIDCNTKKTSFEFFDRMDLVDLWLFGDLSDSAKMNAYRKTKPQETLSASMQAFAVQTAAAADALPPAPRYVVQPVSSTVVGDRPVYRMNANGSRNTTAVAGKRAIGNTPCNQAKRIQTTSYYEVPTVGADLYAACILK